MTKSSAQMSDDSVLAALHGDLEILRGRSISIGQLRRLEDRWRKTGLAPGWLSRDPTLTRRVFVALARRAP